MTVMGKGPAGRAATLADVAKAAGVSLATASKALNGRPDVGQATRLRVTEAARTLEFAPNELARSLSSGRTGSVGLLTDDLEGRFALPVMIGAEDALGEAQTIALLANSRGRRDLEQRHLTALLGRRIDGLLLVGKGPEEREPLTVPAGIAAVYAYAPSSDPADVSVICDHYGGGVMATEHLIASGRRRIAHLGGPLQEHAIGRDAARARARGTVDALQAHGLPVVAGAPLHGDWLEQWGWDATDRLLDSEEVDGLVCGNDQIARGAIDLLLQRGVRVPDDVAVIGFDNAPQMSSLGRLPQSTIDMDLYNVGRTAARVLLEPTAWPKGRHALAGHLIVRSSTQPGAPRQRH